MYDLWLRNGKLVTPDGCYQADLLVKQGRIAAIFRPGEPDFAPEVARTIDLEGRWVLPGAVDLHTHIEEPGTLEKEDITSGTQSAASGGVTTVVLMPNCTPPVNSAERVESRAEAMKARSFVDFALLGAAGGESIPDMVSQAEAGVVGYKSYTGSYRADREGLLCRDTADVYQVLEQSALVNRFVAFHCADNATMKLLKGRLLGAGRTRFSDYHASRPEFVETLDMLPLLELARETQGILHLVHMSSPWAIQLANIFREGGTRVTVETCPHYLTFSDEDTARLGPYAQVDPPLRSPGVRDRLWELASIGQIDLIASDHAPGTQKEKQAVMNNLLEFGGGLPALETLWPLMLNACNQGRISLSRLVEVVAEKPARVAQLYPQKGSLRVGADADLVIADLEETYTLEPDRFYLKLRDAARIFKNYSVKGRVKHVFQRGQLLAEDGELVMDKPIGARWLKPRSP